MSEKGCHIMRRINLAVLLCLCAGISDSRAQDVRELVSLPKPMQEHRLGNMRDHLATLNEIFRDLADNKFDEAAKIAEQRLGMSSLIHSACMAPTIWHHISRSRCRTSGRACIAHRVNWSSCCKTHPSHRRSMPCAISTEQFTR